MQQIGTENPSRQSTPAASGRTGLWISLIGIAALVVVTQTLVELVGMVVYVRLVPRLVPLTPR